MGQGYAAVVIEPRFHGPPRSANGGYACGLLGARIGAAAEVTLRAPPPLGEPLSLVDAPGGGLELRRGDTLVAAGRPLARALVEVPAPVALEVAEAAAKGFPWFEGHPFPTCFVCGPERSPGDGLRIFPGAVEGRAVAAAPWRPDPSVVADDGRVPVEIVWAALDCPSWFGLASLEPWSGPVLLGRLAARVARRPRAGEPCVAMGWHLATEGRKVFCASALLDAGGGLLGVAEATWIAAKPA